MFVSLRKQAGSEAVSLCVSSVQAATNGDVDPMDLVTFLYVC